MDPMPPRRAAASPGRLSALALGLALTLAPASLAAAEPTSATITLGAVGILDDPEWTSGSLELVFPPRTLFWLPDWWPESLASPRPIAGISAVSDGSAFPYFGFRFDLPWGRRLLFTPSVGVGTFLDGERLDLGSKLEFRSSAELSIAITERSHLGIAFRHVSNAGISRPNPGTELLDLTYSFDFSP